MSPRYIETRNVPLGEIEVGPRQRPADPAWVEALAMDMAEVGQLTPVMLFEKRAGGYVLGPGLHRLEAVRRLGASHIRAEIYRGGADARALAESDENLFRHDLSPLDRGATLAARKAAYERLHPETKRGIAGAKARHDKENYATEIISFAEIAAEHIGLTARAVQLSIALYETLGEDVRRRVAGTPLARNQAELIALSKLDPDRRQAVLDRLLSEAEDRPRKVAEADLAAAGAPSKRPHDEIAFERLCTAFGRLPRRQQRRFLAFVTEALPARDNQPEDGT